MTSSAGNRDIGPVLIIMNPSQTAICSSVGAIANLAWSDMLEIGSLSSPHPFQLLAISGKTVDITAFAIQALLVVISHHADHTSTVDLRMSFVNVKKIKQSPNEGNSSVKLSLIVNKKLAKIVVEEPEVEGENTWANSRL